MTRLEPVAVDVEKALVGPVARGDEEDEEQDRAINAGAVEEVGEEEEGDDESRVRLVVFCGFWLFSHAFTHNGDALVGMKRSGSQLFTVSRKQSRRAVQDAHLLRQNMSGSGDPRISRCRDAEAHRHGHG